MQENGVMFDNILYQYTLLSLLSYLLYTFERSNPQYPLIIRSHTPDNNDNDNNEVSQRILHMNLDRFGGISLLSPYYHRGNTLTHQVVFTN